MVNKNLVEVMLKLLVKIGLRGCVIFLKNCTFLKCYNFVMLVTPLVQIEFFSTCYSPQWLLKKIGWVSTRDCTPRAARSNHSISIILNLKRLFAFRLVSL